ncbi:MAG: SMP-30/gluconolactonase/LRE family protein [Ginsengibacter sp.]
MSQSHWEVVTKHSCLLGEGPVWDKKEKRIIWIDIINGEIQYFYPGSNEHNTCKTGHMLGAVALKRTGGMIGAAKGGFATIDLNNGATHIICKVETHLPGNRFNDGKCDAAGRFWAGTMSMSNMPHAGSLYTLEKDGTTHTKLTAVSCSNGIAWSPDNTTLYYIDSPTRQVVAYEYDIVNGNIIRGRVVIDIPEGEGFPDGMTIDTEGMLWIAIWDGWKVARYNPLSGEQLHEIILPVSQVTSCIFGGDTLNDLYITSAREGLSEEDLKEQPMAGCLFVIKNCGFNGIDAFEYDG